MDTEPETYPADAYPADDPPEESAPAWTGHTIPLEGPSLVLDVSRPGADRVLAVPWDSGTVRRLGTMAAAAFAVVASTAICVGGWVAVELNPARSEIGRTIAFGGGQVASDLVVSSEPVNWVQDAPARAPSTSSTSGIPPADLGLLMLLAAGIALTVVAILFS